MSITALTTDTLDHAIDSHRLLVIEFWATWCGPCRSFSKILSNVAEDYPEIFFGSVNIEKEKKLAQEFAVQSIPFVMIIKNRVVVYAESGALSESAVRELLSKAQTLKQEK